jgi:O-antigen/teichoic acid export membrane protein
VLVGSPWILAAFGRHARDTGVGSLVLLALATVPYAVLTVASRAAAVAGRVRVAVVPQAVALAVALAGGWVLTPAVGVLGAAFSWLAGVTLVAVSVLVRDRSMITQPVA